MRHQSKLVKRKFTFIVNLYAEIARIKASPTAAPRYKKCASRFQPAHFDHNI
jgi:hypothetical protein